MAQKHKEIVIEKQRIPSTQQVLDAKVSHFADRISEQSFKESDPNLIKAYEQLVNQFSEKDIIFKCLAQQLAKSLVHKDRYPVRDLFDKQPRSDRGFNKGRSSRRPFNPGPSKGKPFRSRKKKY